MHYPLVHKRSISLTIQILSIFVDFPQIKVVALRCFHVDQSIEVFIHNELHITEYDVMANVAGVNASDLKHVIHTIKHQMQRVVA